MTGREGYSSSVRYHWHHRVPAQPHLRSTQHSFNHQRCHTNAVTAPSGIMWAMKQGIDHAPTNQSQTAETSAPLEHTLESGVMAAFPESTGPSYSWIGQFSLCRSQLVVSHKSDDQTSPSLPGVACYRAGSNQRLAWQLWICCARPSSRLLTCDPSTSCSLRNVKLMPYRLGHPTRSCARDLPFSLRSLGSLR